GRQDVANQVVSAHIRALMAPQSFDVASSDRHTVKPWFAGKLAFAPKVIDLSTQGFPLVGARIDVIGLEPVASLVYSKGKHQISVMEMPNPRGLSTQVTQHAEQGYQALSWSDGKITYWVVSDAADEELKNFVGLFQVAACSVPQQQPVLLYVTMPNRARTCPIWGNCRHHASAGHHAAAGRSPLSATTRLPPAYRLLAVTLRDLPDELRPGHVDGAVDGAGLRSRIVLEDFHHQ